MTQYIQDLSFAHPDVKPCPNMHMAIHISHFLCLFGPVHSWWCFPFEWLIGQIQRLLSNHRFGTVPLSHVTHTYTESFYAGQMESTMLHSFLKASNLKCWLAKPDCPTVIKECKVLFKKIYMPRDSECDVFENGAHADYSNTWSMSARGFTSTVRSIAEQCHHARKDTP
jgi:hypothetical protein